MALSELESRIGQLGNELAQQHYATTTDADGPLPWLPTDADRAKLQELLERGPTLEEITTFESGYKESILRLAGNAQDRRVNPVLRAEVYSVLAKYGIALPPDGSPERSEAETLIADALVQLRSQVDALRPPPPPVDEPEPPPVEELAPAPP